MAKKYNFELKVFWQNDKALEDFTKLTESNEILKNIGLKLTYRKHNETGVKLKLYIYGTEKWTTTDITKDSIEQIISLIKNTKTQPTIKPSIRNGYHNKEAAIKTLELIATKDFLYQHQTVYTLYQRAKKQEQTSDIKAAIKIFEEWLEEIKKRRRSHSRGSSCCSQELSKKISKKFSKKKTIQVKTLASLDSSPTIDKPPTTDKTISTEKQTTIEKPSTQKTPKKKPIDKPSSTTDKPSTIDKQSIVEKPQTTITEQTLELAQTSIEKEQPIEKKPKKQKQTEPKEKSSTIQEAKKSKK